MRRTLIIAAALVVIPLAVKAAPTVYDQVWGDRVEERLCDLEAEVGIESVECETTTQPPTELVIPPTEPYPPRNSGYEPGGGYDIIASNAETGTNWWIAPYWGEGLPYTEGAKWISGDRQGYQCGYGFITDAGGEIAGRFAFVRGAAYGFVNDKFMEEAERYLDGTPFTGTTREITDEDCTDVSSDINYEGACRDVDERPRVGFFDADGHVLDIRDYTNTNATGVSFNLHGFDGTRATVLACEDGLVGMIVYYDALGDGQLAVDFNGQGPFG